MNLTSYRKLQANQSYTDSSQVNQQDFVNVQYLIHNNSSFSSVLKLLKCKFFNEFTSMETVEIEGSRVAGRDMSLGNTKSGSNHLWKTFYLDCTHGAYTAQSSSGNLIVEFVNERKVVGYKVNI